MGAASPGREWLSLAREGRLSHYLPASVASAARLLAVGVYSRSLAIRGRRPLSVPVAGEVGVRVGGLEDGRRRLGGEAPVDPLLLGRGERPEQRIRDFLHFLHTVTPSVRMPAEARAPAGGCHSAL